ncbi:MAG: rRNA small subunit methyltransferase H [Candidatus Carbobacillus altaicus]|uniref:Ribosomal RNA small subunit methyltransferase H n=1 Tax=Candidatus Carbonibacillus altaicus TaxID=2163959 RepID=A0A2R6Y383_9BACL|nr:MAG: rRNA small subunit methyltransferase H [Candidatus Carbobacillus altaicus]
MEDKRYEHVPVMLNEVLEGLNLRPDGLYVDCTFGRGGHSFAIAKRLQGGRLIALDQDEEAIRHGTARIESEGWTHVTLVRANFRDLADVLLQFEITAVCGILYDLGVSSPQFDEGTRGFSYKQDAPLDMRMDQRSSLTAYTIVNTWDEDVLKDIIARYGEERFAARIARAIVRAREKQPIETTGALAELVKAAIPAKYRRTGPHPARRTFQALRIAVNDELNHLKQSLTQAIQFLDPGGRLAVMSFHSLEDRIVKEMIRQAEDPCWKTEGRGALPCPEKPLLKRVYKKALQPSEQEIANNPRARSAKLRIAEKLA